MNIVKELKERYEKNSDVKYKHLDMTRPLDLFFAEGLVHTRDIENFIIGTLESIVRHHEDLLTSHLLQIEALELDFQLIDQRLFSGMLIIIDARKIYALNLISQPARNPEQSNIDITISGPRDSFVENIQINTALIRKRLKSDSLKYETFTVGRRSQTMVGLFYIDDIINMDLIDDIRRKIQSIETDAIISASQFRSFLYEDEKTALPLATYTQRPDYCVSSLLAGKFVILLDNFNNATVAPVTLPFFTDFSDDVNDHYLTTVLNRLIYFVSLGISLYLMAFVLALYSYSPDQLPIILLANMISMRKGVILPVPLEIIFATFLFELFRIAGTRLPAGISSTLLVIGGVLLGSITIVAGLISYDIMFLTALSIICNYSISNNISLNNMVSFLKLLVFLLCLAFGAYGFILSVIWITAYFCTKHSFHQPFMSPLAPLHLKDLPKMFLGRNFTPKSHRPEAMQTKDVRNR